MSELFCFILICFGCTNILAYGKIFNAIRPKYHFFHCPMCIGFWVGVFFSFFLKMPILISSTEWLNIYMKDGFNAFACGCLSSGTSYILAMMIGDEGIRYENKSTRILGKRI